jgi:hypothetical protein
LHDGIGRYSPLAFASAELSPDQPGNRYQRAMAGAPRRPDTGRFHLIVTGASDERNTEDDTRNKRKADIAE